MNKIAKLFIFCIPLVFAAAAGAEVVSFDDPAREKRYQNLIQELRCLVCQNQTLAESNAELAADMRAVVAEMLKAGAKDEEISAFMTDRYGDFVRYRPPFKLKTAALWFAPFALVVFLLVFLAPRFFRRRNTTAKDDSRAQQAAKILAEDE